MPCKIGPNYGGCGGGPSPTAPFVSSLSVTSGPVDGGFAVRLIGFQFANGATVAFGGASVSSTFVSVNELDVIAPAHASGDVQVVVTNPSFETSNGEPFTYSQITDLVRVRTVYPPNG